MREGQLPSRVLQTYIVTNLLSHFKISEIDDGKFVVDNNQKCLFNCFEIASGKKLNIKGFLDSNPSTLSVFFRMRLNRGVSIETPWMRTIK